MKTNLKKTVLSIVMAGTMAITCMLPATAESTAQAESNKIQYHNKSRNARPPDKRIAKWTDALFHSFANFARIKPDWAFHHRPLIPVWGKRVGCLQLAVVTKHTFLVINHPLDQTVIRPIAHRNIGQNINQSRNQHKEDTAEANCLKKFRIKTLQNLLVVDSVRRNIRMLRRINILPEPLYHG